MELLREMVAEVGPVLGAFLLALPVAWDRERADRSLGIRTFPLVAMGACAFVLTARVAFDGQEEAVSRAVDGTISGIGFLGAAAVVKRGITVHGSATAAAIWVTAAIGVAAALGAWPIALVLSALGFGTLRWLAPLKQIARGHSPPADRAPEDKEVTSSSSS